MVTRRFGRTELRMPVLTCGGMRYQQSWTRDTPWSRESQRNLEATIDRAIAAGINHIETARGYGTSESQLGVALARHPRDAFLIQTKIAPHDDWRTFARNLEDSFKRLRVDHLDLMSFHGINTRRRLEQTLGRGHGDSGCIDVAEAFRHAGRISHIGFSTHAPTPIILAAIASGRFDYVNLHYYFIFRDNRPALAAAQAQDMGVFIISPSDKGGRLYQPPRKLVDLCTPLSPMGLNDLWCLAHPEIHTLSVGAARPSDFDAHLAVLPALEAEDPEQLAALIDPVARRLEDEFRRVLGAEFAARWSEGLREWDELPGRINVRRILWLSNLARAWDMLDFAQERYAAMNPDDEWVPGARADPVDAAAMVAALPDSPYRAQIPALLREAHALLWNPDVEPGP